MRGEGGKLPGGRERIEKRIDMGMSSGTGKRKRQDNHQKVGDGLGKN